MTKARMRDTAGIAARQKREVRNIFARLPSIYAASRMQGQHLLQIGGGLSIVEWRVLWDLAEVGPMSIRDLASIQRADHSLLSRALPDMRQKGYVEMGRDPEDGRQTIVSITAKGQTAYERAAPVMARRRAALLEVFNDDEITEFVGYLNRLEEFLRQPIESILTKDNVE